MDNFHNEGLIYPEEISLKVVDLEKMARFYKEIMGFRTLEEESNKVVLSLDGKSSFLTLKTDKTITPKSRGKTGLYHFAILLPSREHLGSFINHLIKVGYNQLGGSNHGVSEALYIQDPEDNGIEIYADVDQEEWIYNGDQVKMVTEPLDYKKLMELGKDLEFNNISEETILGHIHLHVGDLENALRFYNTIGFKLVSSLAGSAYFISTGGYHHHIGMNVWNGRGAQAPKENEAGLDYYTLRVPVGKINDILKNLEESNYIFVAKGEGISTKDPSGNSILFK